MGGSQGGSVHQALGPAIDVVRHGPVDHAESVYGQYGQAAFGVGLRPGPMEHGEAANGGWDEAGLGAGWPRVVRGVTPRQAAMKPPGLDSGAANQAPEAAPARDTGWGLPVGPGGQGSKASLAFRGTDGQHMDKAFDSRLVEQAFAISGTLPTTPPPDPRRRLAGLQHLPKHDLTALSDEQLERQVLNVTCTSPPHCLVRRPPHCHCLVRRPPHCLVRRIARAQGTALGLHLTIHT